MPVTNPSRLLISAAHKSSGKTTVAVGLAAAFAARALAVQPFKKGPDYIDPMWLSRASGRPCYNLDFNTQTGDEIRTMFASRSAGAAVSLIEGNMGLHDGVDEEGADSTAALARLLGAPVVLVIDCEGMTRGVAPLVLGFSAFDPSIRVAGVILNRVATARQESKLRAAIERYTDIPVLGAMRRSGDMTIVERHLGLTTPSETGGINAKIAVLASGMRDQVDLDRVLEIARSAHPVRARRLDLTRPGAGGDVTIAVARDAAFGFYYADDLEALERAGARLVPFSPIGDTRLPDADGIFLGGGFPETHMAALEANGDMRADIRRAADRGIPIYAECGGMMYLARSIRWGEECRRMTGVIAADVVMHERPQGRGLVEIEPSGACPWPAGDTTPARIRAHEFHHAELVNVPAEATFAWRVVRGFGIDGHHDGIVVGNVMASFVHQRSTSANAWTSRFVAFVRSSRPRRASRATSNQAAMTAVAGSL